MITQNYAFTYFNFNDSPIDYKSIPKVKYMIVGLETCPKTQKQHHQGFVKFEDKIRLTQAKKRFGNNTIHIEVMYSKEWCNIKYCEKEKNVIYEVGIRPEKKGQRTDIQTFFKDIKTNDELQMWEKHPIEMLRYNKAYDRYKSAILKKQSKEQRELEVIYIWGKSRTGKTRHVYENNPDVYRVDHGNSDGKLWFDGYEGQEVILFDDFRSAVKFSYMLELLDRYPMQLQVKGGYTYKNWKKVYITSNIPPEEQYPNLAENLEPFLRRIKKILHMTGSPLGLALRNKVESVEDEQDI